MKMNKGFRAMAWVLALLLVVGIVWWLGTKDISQTLRGVKLPWVALALATYFVATMARYAKWRIMLGKDFSRSETALAFCSSKALGTIMPARLGELAPLLTARFRTHRVAAAIAVDRLVETLGTTVIAVFAWAFLPHDDVRITVALLVVSVGIASSFALLLYEKPWHYLAKKTARFARIASLFQMLLRVSHASRAFGWSYVWLVVLSIIPTALEVVQAQFLYVSLGAWVEWPLLFTLPFVYGVVSLVSITPGGLGIADIPVLYLLRAVPAGALGGCFLLNTLMGRGLPWVFLGGATVWWRSKHRVNDEVDVLDNVDLR